MYVYIAMGEYIDLPFRSLLLLFLLSIYRFKWCLQDSFFFTSTFEISFWGCLFFSFSRTNLGLSSHYI